jgi:purine-cytosine permease-like protein
MPQQVTTAQALTIVSSFIIGCSVWGNEADFWRFSRPTRRHVALPLLAALVIGAIIFPTAGWLLAHKTGITDLAGVAGLLNSYVANYLSVLPALILIVPNFAVNDSNLYSATNAAQNLFAAPRRVLVAGVAAIGSLIAVLLYQSAQNFQIVASLSSVLLPPATIIILTEAFFFGSPPRKEDWLEHLSEAADARKFRWPAVAALAAGCGVGLLTTGILPGTEALHRGIPALHACGTSFLAYVILRRLDPQPLFRKTPLE